MCPYCDSEKIITIYRPEIYEFAYFCRDCDRGFNQGGVSVKRKTTRNRRKPNTQQESK